MRDTTLPRVDKFLEIGDNTFRWNEGNKSWDQTVERSAYKTSAVFQYAELNENDEVIWLTHVDPARAPTEKEGVAYCKSLFGANTRWAVGGMGKRNYAEVGRKLFREYDLFLPHKPFPSWVIDYVHFCWTSPEPFPEDGKFYEWDEATKSWRLMDPQPPFPSPIAPVDPSGVTGDDYAD